MPNMLPQYSTVLFTDVWEDVNEFLSDYSGATAVGIPAIISNNSATTLY